MSRMVQKIWVLKTIPNVKVPSYDEDVININFSILKILQGQLGQVWIYINQKITWTLIEKGNTR